MDYQHYTIEDFLQDAYFREWVLTPNASNRAFWTGLIEQYPEKSTLIEEAKRIILLIEMDTATVPTQKTDVQWKRLEDTIASDAVLSIKRRRMWLNVAAAISTLLLLSLSAYWLLYQDTIRFATNYGQVKTVTLPDNSRVTLSANSALEYRKRDDRREVWLEGEGFFEVVHTQHHQAFVVHTRGPEVEVLGTTFYVNNRERQVQVVLNSGRVRVHHEQQEMQMIPGELVAYHEDTHALSKRITNPRLHSAWKDNLIIFDRTPLHKIAQLLEDHYGYKVIFHNKLMREETFTGTFPADRVHILLTTLQKSMPMTVQERRIVFGNP